jgi:hypothetical protein
VESTVQRFRLIAVSVLAVVALTLILNIGNVYAQTLTLIPNPVTQGMNVQASGTGWPYPYYLYVKVWADNTGSCAGSPLLTMSTWTSASGAFGPVTIPTSSLSVGTHCVEAVGVVSTVTELLTVDPAPPIPEYPFGLSLLAIFMVIGYGVIRRKAKH